jgi:hypothetical protein
MDETTNTDSSWSEWLQKVSSGVIDKYASAQWVQPYETERMRLQALGDLGLGYYTEGQRVPMPGQQQFAGINTGTLLLIGGVLVAVLLLKK